MLCLSCEFFLSLFFPAFFHRYSSVPLKTNIGQTRRLRTKARVGRVITKEYGGVIHFSVTELRQMSKQSLFLVHKRLLDNSIFLPFFNNQCLFPR